MGLITVNNRITLQPHNPITVKPHNRKQNPTTVKPYNPTLTVKNIKSFCRLRLFAYLCKTVSGRYAAKAVTRLYGIAA